MTPDNSDPPAIRGRETFFKPTYNYHLAEEAESVAKCLDDREVPREQDGKSLSLWGRVVLYATLSERAIYKDESAITTGGTNDLVHLACLNAHRSFGGTDGVFTSACFGLEMTRLANLETPMDGRMVEVVLSGRKDVIALSSAYWKIDNQQPSI